MQDGSHRCFGVGVAHDRVGVDDVDVAGIDDPDLVQRQIDHIVLVVVGAGMAEGEQRRRLADGTRSEAGAGSVLGAHVERHAEHRDVGIDGPPVGDRGALSEGAVTDERQIETSRLVAVAGHRFSFMTDQNTS